MVYVKLFWEFLKVGLFSFGGAYSGIPLIRDVVIKNNWCSAEQFSDIIAISESTPGAIIVNLATYVGSIQAGFLGSIIATIAVILPAFVIIILFTKYFNQYLKKPIIKSVFDTIRISITAVILSTGIVMLIENIFNQKINSLNIYITNDIMPKLIIFAILSILLIIYTRLKRRMNTIFFIVISGILGIIVFSINQF